MVLADGGVGKSLEISLADQVGWIDEVRRMRLSVLEVVTGGRPERFAVHQVPRSR